MESRGIIMFNRGPNMVVDSLITLYSLRKYYNGNITFYIEEPTPIELEESLAFFNCNIIHNEKRHDLKTLVRKNSLFENPPYTYTLWIDIDTVIVGNIDKMFDYLIEKNVDLCIPSFCDWKNSGRQISKRINGFNGIAEERHIKEALKEDHYSINTGVLAFKRSEKWNEFVRYWTDLADRGAKAGKFIPDETAAGILIPNMGEWGLKYFIAPLDYNVSVKYGKELSKDPRIIHGHGSKSFLDFPLCGDFKAILKEMLDKDIAGISNLIKYSDKRLKEYFKNKDCVVSNVKYTNNDVTIVSACDNHYVDILRETFPNWRKYKKIDNYPVIIYINGIELNDVRLDFLRLPNVKMIPWEMKNAENHREEMLSAFVYGPARDVKTEFWMKLDADSYAINYKPLIEDFMKKYDAFIGHKWSYSRPEHIKKLDEWAKNHWQKKLKMFKPMMGQGKIDGNRFYHKNRRTISFIQLHKTKFSRFCIKLVNGEKLPCPSHDTYYYYVAQVFNPEAMATHNFKKDNGFTQGNGRLGVEHIKKCLENVELQNEKELDSDYKDEIENIDGLDILENNECICQEQPIEDKKSEYNYIDKVIHSNLRNKNLEYEVVIREK